MCKYKITGTFSISNINGGAVSGEAVFDNTTLYPNPNMTLTHEGYTKHYFMGSERVGATIGGGNNGNWLVYPIDNLTQRETNLLSDLENGSLYKLAYYDCYDYPHLNSHTSNTDVTGTIEYGDAEYPDYQYDDPEQYYGNIWLYFKGPLADNITDYYLRDAADEPYYYHSDHLGSAAWITEHHGEPAQHLMFAPYGEELLNQHPFSYNERFTFTGKERDAETGYDYFGARYRESNFLNHFISVDPLADKFIDKTPYLYCEGNPIKFVDPDGQQIAIKGVINNEEGTSIVLFYYGEIDGVRGFYHNGQRLDSEFANKATDAIGKIHDGGKYGKMLVEALVKDDRTVEMLQTAGQNQSLIHYNALKWNVSDFNFGILGVVPGYIVLSHEFAHLMSSWYGFADYGLWYKDENILGNTNVLNDEKWAVNVENLIRIENNLEMRKYYSIPNEGKIGMGEIPHWDWVKDFLEIICRF